MSVQTHSLKAYSASRGISPIKALEELWKVAKGRSPTSDNETLGIACDLNEWRNTGELPRYAKEGLNYERLRQIEIDARQANFVFP